MLVSGSSLVREGIGTVEKVTKLHIVLKNGRKFRKSDGSEVSGHSSWHSIHISQVTEKDRKRIRRRKAIEFLKGFDFSKLSTGTLLQLVGIVKEKIDGKQEEEA